MFCNIVLHEQVMRNLRAEVSRLTEDAVFEEMLLKGSQVSSDLTPWYHTSPPSAFPSSSDPSSSPYLPPLAAHSPWINPPSQSGHPSTSQPPTKQPTHKFSAAKYSSSTSYLPPDPVRWSNPTAGELDHILRGMMPKYNPDLLKDRDPYETHSGWVGRGKIPGTGFDVNARPGTSKEPSRAGANADVDMDDTAREDNETDQLPKIEDGPWNYYGLPMDAGSISMLNDRLDGEPVQEISDVDSEQESSYYMDDDNTAGTASKKRRARRQPRG
jgi:hypothetical protein